MTTKELIEELQKADPSGNAHVRLPDGGAVWYASLIPGYWDGSYQYLEKIDPNGNYNYSNVKLITSTKGDKVDIHTFDLDNLIWDLNGDMEEIKKRIEFKLTYLNETNEERKEKFLKSIEEEAKYAKKRDDSFLKEWYSEMIDQYFFDEYTWEIRQPLNEPIGRYHCMKAYKEGATPEPLNQGQCDILIRSGKFYPEKKENYYVWKHNPEKGKDWSIKKEDN